MNYKKIKLYSSKDFAKNQETFDERKNAVEKLVKENNIEYALEIAESYGPGDAPKAPKMVYTLNLVVKLEDLAKVKDILDTLYQFEYEITETVEIEEEAVSNMEDNDGDAIKNANTINEPGITFKEKFEKMEPIGKFSVFFIIVIYVLLIMFHIALIIEAGIQTGMVIAILIETFIFIKSLKSLLNKKGE